MKDLLSILMTIYFSIVKTMTKQVCSVDQQAVSKGTGHRFAMQGRNAIWNAYRQMEFMLLLVLCLNLLGTCNGCPLSCKCDPKKSLVACQSLQGQNLALLLNKIPGDTQYLRLSGATINDFPVDTFKNFDALRYLRITRTNISYIAPGALAMLTNLTQLHLDQNHINEFHIGDHNGLVSLQVLNLSHNFLVTISKDSFLHLTSLRMLDLSHNNISVLPAETFNSLAALQVLDLSDNKLNYIHPNLFQNAQLLTSIDFSFNELSYLHGATFSNLTLLEQVHVINNPWHCDCRLHWLIPGFKNYAISKHLSLLRNITCTMPKNLLGKQLHSLNNSNFVCEEPLMPYVPQNTSIQYLHDVVLHCNVTGSPNPSIYWITPRGSFIAHSSHHKWISPDILQQLRPNHHYSGGPSYHKSNVFASSDGTLHIKQARSYFSGEYTCVAVNPSGVISATLILTLTSAIPNIVISSVVISFMSAGIFLMFGIIVGSIRLLIEFLLRKCHKGKEEFMWPDYNIEVSTASSDGQPSSSSSPKHSAFRTPRSWTPDDSPVKYPTPAEEDGEKSGEGIVNIRETLEDVRIRLRSGMERAGGRIRSRAQHVRESGSRAMQTIKESSSQAMHNLRESGSQYIHTIRSSGGQYASRMRTGVVLGVEQVKYHVKSLKELCGTGDIGQTISMISVATDVDAQEKSEAIKSISVV